MRITRGLYVSLNRAVSAVRREGFMGLVARVYVLLEDPVDAGVRMMGLPGPVEDCADGVVTYVVELDSGV